ncbi:MAG TPA: cyanophycinase [Longimicrobiales bacterium]|nr:cyanophycinase [Longimicrobiales bacterium]
MTNPMRRVPAYHWLAPVVAVLLAACSASAQVRNGLPADAPVTGPARGALVVAGGGSLGTDVMGRFIDLAGGADARIVILPGAGTDDVFPDNWPGYAVFRRAGVREVTVLHTRDRGEADTDDFVDPLRTATGVWIPGGRQWRLVDAYLDTRTMAALHEVLERGGVIGGTSAGASIQSSYMVRGAVAGNTIMMAPGYEDGFAFLRNTAVDQHLLARGREDHMLEVVARHPHLLGIGLDEGTAIVVQGDDAEVVGRGSVAFYNAADRGDLPYYFLGAGDRFDLGARRVTSGRPIPQRVARDRHDVIAAMDRLFAAMRTQDTAAIRAMAHPELRIHVPGGAPDAPTLRTSTLQQFMDLVAGADARLDERAIDPEVRMDGNLASVWTYYDFRRGEAFSHCGYDAFHFARTAHAGWQIIGLAYTTRQEGCRRP